MTSQDQPAARVARHAPLPAPETDLRVRAAWSLLAAQPILALVGCGLTVASRLGSPRGFFDIVGPLFTMLTVYAPAMALAGGAAAYALALRGGGGRWLRRLSAACAILAALALAGGWWITSVEPNRLVVRRVEIATNKVTRPIRIVHASDIQSDAVGEREARAIAAIAAEKPDLFLYTGDLLQVVPPRTNASELPKIDALLRTIEAPLGKFAVLGDVDWNNQAALREGVGGMTLLASEEATVDARGATIRLYGLGLLQSRARMDLVGPLDEWAGSLAPTDFAILLGHGPDFAMDAVDSPIDLCLAGHTHGGQIRLPFYGPIMTLSDVPRDWARGFREIGPRTRLNVSAGIGCERGSELPPMRLLCPPEFTVIDLVPAAEARR